MGASVRLCRRAELGILCQTSPGTARAAGDSARPSAGERKGQQETEQHLDTEVGQAKFLQQFDQVTVVPVCLRPTRTVRRTRTRRCIPGYLLPPGDSVTR